MDTPPEAAALDLERLEDSREAFEDWAHSSHWTNRDVFGRYESGEYVSPSLAIAWEVWQAARQHAAPQGSRVGGAPDAELREAIAHRFRQLDPRVQPLEWHQLHSEVQAKWLDEADRFLEEPRAQALCAALSTASSAQDAGGVGDASRLKTAEGLLYDLHGLVMGEAARLLNEDCGGDANLALDIEEFFASRPDQEAGRAGMSANDRRQLRQGWIEHRETSAGRSAWARVWGDKIVAALSEPAR